MSDFEERLRDRLRDLADTGPAGPDPNRLRRSLRRRTLVRVTASTAALLVIVSLVLRPPAATPRDLPEALHVQASSIEARQALEAYLSRIGLDGTLLVSRRPGEPLSLALAGSPPLEIERLRLGLEALLANYAIVELRAERSRIASLIIGT